MDISKLTVGTFQGLKPTVSIDLPVIMIKIIIIILNLKDPALVWIYNVFSTKPVSRPRKTTSKVALPPGGIT